MADTRDTGDPDLTPALVQAEAAWPRVDKLVSYGTELEQDNPTTSLRVALGGERR